MASAIHRAGAVGVNAMPAWLEGNKGLGQAYIPNSAEATSVGLESPWGGLWIVYCSSKQATSFRLVGLHDDGSGWVRSGPGTPPEGAMEDR